MRLLQPTILGHRHELRHLRRQRQLELFDAGEAGFVVLHLETGVQCGLLRPGQLQLQRRGACGADGQRGDGDPCVDWSKHSFPRVFVSLRS